MATNGPKPVLTESEAQEKKLLMMQKMQETRRKMQQYKELQAEAQKLQDQKSEITTTYGKKIGSNGY